MPGTDELDDAQRAALEAAKELVTKLAAHCRVTVGEPSPENWRKVFNLYDRNKDGRIQEEELSAWLADADIGNFLTRSMWVAGIFERVDTAPRDTGISLSEFMDTLAKNMRDPDLLNDGLNRVKKQLEDFVPSADVVQKAADAAKETVSTGVVIALVAVGLIAFASGR